MPKRCVFGCPYTKHYHQFPHPERNPDGFNAWVHVVGGKLENQDDYEQYRKKVVCDVHFTDKDRNRNNRLNFMAVPSLHLHGKYRNKHIDNDNRDSVDFSEDYSHSIIGNLSNNKTMVKLTVEDYGLHKDKNVKKFTWSLSSGFSVSVISYGAIVQSIKVPDRYGIPKDVVLGFDDLESYVSRNIPYLGAIIGRCANRIANASFEIDGQTYQLAKNIANEHHLHGGLLGFDKMVWETTVEENKVIFSYLSKDGEEGYPGDLVTNVTYEVTDDGSLHMDIIATTTKKTVVNLTNHSYFNLAGHDQGSEELYNHHVLINADRITETDFYSIPTGSFTEVRGTPFDLTKETRLGDVMSGNLFDNNFCVNIGEQDLTFVSRVTHPSSGRVLEVYSDQPGVQFYTANFLPLPCEEALVGKGAVGYRRHGAFCLETQKFPDAVHHRNFPSVILTPGQIYKHRVLYKFFVNKNMQPEVVSN